MRAHLPAMNAAIGRAQLARFDVVEARRKKLWMAYRDAIGKVSGVTIVDVDAEHSVPFNCVVRLHAGRDRIFADLRAGGVGVGVHYPPNHTQPAFAAWYTPLPATEQVAQQVLSLPFHPALDPSAIGHVISELERALP
jgi:dTDP-4-amino-4,6-dideoxygalactose transaminase